MVDQTVKVFLKNGGKIINDYSDYLVQDGILTVFRNEQFECYNYKMDMVEYKKFHVNIPMENVLYFEVIEGC